jgi:malonyl-CoA/methylmalonyl-CoA synthetase
MVSGSAALPAPLFARWEELSGHRLLERYGMTEIGMALSNPLRGERVPGSVGAPLPGVGVRLSDEAGAACADGVPGELRVSGPTLFREYHGRPEETARAFDGGWFLTGDVAVREEGRFRILGRASTDILKTGGYKVSALEIEDVLRLFPGLRDVAVVGLPDDEWGERVAAAVVVEGAPPTLQAVGAWARDRLAPYKVPTRLLVVPDLPRNAMGKVTKAAVKSLFGTRAEHR